MQIYLTKPKLNVVHLNFPLARPLNTCCISGGEVQVGRQHGFNWLKYLTCANMAEMYDHMLLGILLGY